MATGQMICDTARLDAEIPRWHHFLASLMITVNIQQIHDVSGCILCFRGRWALETVPNTVVAGFMMRDMAMDPIGWAAGICCCLVVPGAFQMLC